MHSFLKNVFKKPTDHVGINAVMRDKNTEFFVIENTQPDTNKAKVLGCVIFRTFHRPPFGAFVSYVALNDKFKLTTLDQTMIS